MVIIKVAFLPPLTEGFKSWVRENVNPSMTAERDKDPKQYSLESIIENTCEEEYQFIATDSAVIQECLDLEIEYLEF